jgi:hypothetical protein
VLDLRATRPQITEAEIDKAYADHLDTVEVVQTGWTW